ncbi:hypothetical protein AAMO2058_001216000 [Amorphochlora amoebiformis]
MDGLPVHDVRVIGAGAGGLGAVWLKRVVLEARDRIGGRDHTIDDFGYPIDLGASPAYRAIDESKLTPKTDQTILEIIQEHWFRAASQERSFLVRRQLTMLSTCSEVTMVHR